MKKVLIVETNVDHYASTDDLTGLWLGESAEFVEEMHKAGIAVDYVSPKGGYVPLDPRGMKYTDEAILKIYENEDFMKRGLSETLSPEQIHPEDYDAIYYTGGHGVMWDFPDNENLQNIGSTIYQRGGYVTSVCHGVAGLLNIKDENNDYLIKGKMITGFTTTEEIMAGKKSVVPFLNQEEVEKRGGHFKKKRFYSDHAIKDGRIITGQNPFSVRSVAKFLIEELNK